MNIALYDPEHYEGLYPLIKLFGNADNRLTIFTSSAALDRLHELLKGEFFHHKWIVIDPQNRNAKYFKRVLALLNVAKADFVVFNSIATHQYYYAKIIKAWGPEKTLVTVHNINNFFEPSPAIGIKTFLNNRGKKYLKNNILYFNVINETLLPKINDLLLPHQEAFSIPGGFAEENVTRTPIEKELVLVVPGTVDPKRRNYQHVLKLASLAEKEKIALKIIINGGIQNEYGLTLIKQIQSQQWNCCKVEYTDYEVVPQPIYDENLKNAHFIWIPSVIHFKVEKGLPEIYGVTKSSGNVFDIIRSRKPYLAPTALLLPDNLLPSGYHYQNLESLLQFLKDIYNNPSKYTEMQSVSEKQTALYSLDNIKANIPKLLEEMVD